MRLHKKQSDIVENLQVENMPKKCKMGEKCKYFSQAIQIQIQTV